MELFPKQLVQIVWFYRLETPELQALLKERDLSVGTGTIGWNHE